MSRLSNTWDQNYCVEAKLTHRRMRCLKRNTSTRRCDALGRTDTTNSWNQARSSQRRCRRSRGKPWNSPTCPSTHSERPSHHTRCQSSCRTRKTCSNQTVHLLHKVHLPLLRPQPVHLTTHHAHNHTHHTHPPNMGLRQCTGAKREIKDLPRPKVQSGR